ncbi:centromere protein C isoform X2 [Choloepus didactylus]|uniref:centromere protein C isoform X2 n=1 Tax=Choloepus didactylus TaxID=27675 RepID=UPI00189D3775|nr:centromere protein C isoform X2 [Choloepus didactylus]
MAAAGLDHLKNVYRRRFCRPSRVPDINTKQDQNIFKILQDCFEEKSLSNDFSTNSTKSVLCSTPKLKDVCIQSPRKECQKSLPESVPVSSRKEEACLPFIVEPGEAANISVQAHEVHEKILATDVGSKNTPDMKNVSSRKLNDHHSEADGEFYLSVGSPSVILDAKTSFSQNAIPSTAQKRETYTSEKSVNVLSSSMETSLKTKKRLNFDKDILKNVEITDKVSEIEDKVSEGPQKRKPSGTFQKRTQDMEYEIQPQAKKSFSTMFLETVKRKSESSSVVRHIATAPPHSSSPNDVKLLEDEFIIDESDKGFSNQSWIIIPRKTGLPKQCTRSPVESTVLLEGKKLREKHHNITSETSTNGKQSHKAQSIQKSKPSEQKELGRNCASTDEMENNYRSTEYVLYSHDAEKSSGNKRTIKQKQKRKFKANVVEERLDMEHSKDKNTNMSCIAQDKFERNSDRDMEKCEEMRNDHVSSKEMLSMGKKKSSTNVSHKEHQKKDKEESKNKRFSNGLKNKLVPDKVTLTITRSRRISRRPSNWWMVKSEQSPVCSNSSSIRNELSVHHNSRQKSAGKTNQSSKNIGEKTIPLRRQKTATQGSSRQQKFLNVKDSEGIIGCDEISSYSQNKSLESGKKDLAKKKNLDRSSGPSRLQNYLASGKNNSDVDEKEVQENSDDSRVKSFEVTENKIHHKLVLPSNTPNVRRTKRTRLKPLEYWRGERVDYEGRPSGGFVIGGVLSPDTVSSKRKAKGNMGKVNKIANRKRICLDDDERKNRLVANLNMPLGDPLQPTRVKDPDTREIILMDLIRPRNTYQFFVEHNELKVYKTLDTSYFSTGKLILGPCQEKGKQHVGPDTLVFYVNFGDLLCTLHETPYIMSTGDSFYVPSGNYYNIKNLLNEESVLLFTQIKR